MRTIFLLQFDIEKTKQPQQKHASNIYKSSPFSIFRLDVHKPQDNKQVTQKKLF